MIESSTITGNTAVGGGGFFKRFYDEWGWGGDTLIEETRIHNTIVAGNAATSDPDLRSGSPSAWEFILPVETSYSLIGDPGDAYITDAIPGSNRFGEDPQLGLLQSNGGPTKTHALGRASPALDSGDPDALLPPRYDCSWLVSSDSCGLVPPDWDQRGEGFERVRNGRIDMGACELGVGEVLKGSAWLRSLGDIDGDGTPGIGVVKRDGYGRDVVSVMDAADGSLVSTFDGTSSGRLVDVAVMPDRDDGPRLVLLGSYASSSPDPVSYSATANTRAVLSGDVIGSFALSPSARLLGLTVLPDQDGNGAAGLGLLTAAPAQVEVRDAFTGTLRGRLTFPARYEPRQVLAFPDLNGNGSAEVGVILSGTGESDRVIISDTLTKRQIRVVMPGSAYRVLTLRGAVVVADRNHNGAADVALLLRNPMTGETPVWVADALTNALLAKVVGYRKDFTPETWVAVSDLTRNGVEEFALLARNTATSEVTAEIRDGANSSLVRRIQFKREFTPLDLVSIGDVNGNGAAELVMLGRCGTEAQLRAFVVDAKTGASLRQLDF
ncbi:choice-of-anchor Q domain-containing protein [Lamprocystis purpurea]|uniref:choice-of-anchor Q domain-containing protein n=1 Tax=Lamprocystis purpurea TaxID=61598 RepID=UPI0003AA4AB9|nr:choice-of-anchor Q domain-containing protein [Lamprocystis purpurea]